MQRTRLKLIFAAALFLPVLALAQPTSEDCLACHSDSSMTMTAADGTEQSVHVDPERFEGSVHAFLSCTDCHTNVSDYPHEAPGKVSCGGCHADSVEAHLGGLHGLGVPGEPTCLSCHGNAHTMLPSSDPASKTSHHNIPETCGSCHGQKFVMEPAGFSIEPFLNYQTSVHGRAIAAGDDRAAVCTDCHEYHQILSPRSEQSPINKFNIPQTCGKCHEGVTEQFRGNSRSPSCTDCHGIHDIKQQADPESGVAFDAISRTTCAQCHGGVRLKELGVSTGRVGTYRQSYHGLLTRFGSTKAANCASCHGVHNILPSSNPDSMIHPANLASTCGSCHPGATDSFAQLKVHLDAPAADDDLSSKVVRWVQTAYIWVIVLVIGGMVIHNLIIWIKKLRAAKRRPGRVIVRMNRNQRIQHMLNLLAFAALVLSGFALAYPDSWFALLMGGNELLRRWMHRVGAIVMMAVGTYHIAYMMGTREGREGIRALFPKWKDVQDVRQMLLWMVGRSQTRPQFDRFSYAEKAEYWALIWGTFIMSVTGLMLWSKVWVSSQVPGWWIDVALAIHFYEAILATLAIIVWHLYAVIFDPDVYPMNYSWLDGKMSPEMYEHEHPLDYRRWRAEHGHDLENPDDGDHHA
ncbi:MAG: cytochrome b/b6 domain-containing protein [Acidobacteria bacterium]|nr:cytochrome b/b6 domain-containing protein [Acidobacteriota bacterium]